MVSVLKAHSKQSRILETVTKYGQSQEMCCHRLCYSEYKLVISTNQVVQHSDLGQARHGMLQNIW